MCTISSLSEWNRTWQCGMERVIQDMVPQVQQHWDQLPHVGGRHYRLFYAYVHTLSNFSFLDTGQLLGHFHIQCAQTMLELGKDDVGLIKKLWECLFKELGKVARLNTTQS